MDNVAIVGKPVRVIVNPTNPYNRIKACEETTNGLKKQGKKEPIVQNIVEPIAKTSVEPSPVYTAKQVLREALNILGHEREIKVVGTNPIKVTNTEPKYRYANMQKNSENLKNPVEIKVEDIAAQQEDIAQAVEESMTSPVGIAPVEMPVPVEVSPEEVDKVVGEPEITAEERTAIEAEVAAEMENAEKEAEDTAQAVVVEESMTPPVDVAPVEMPVPVETAEETKEEENMFSVINNELADKEVTPMPKEETIDNKVIGERIAELNEVKAKLFAAKALQDAKRNEKVQAENKLEEAMENIRRQIAEYDAEANRTEEEAERLAEEIAEKERITAEIYHAMNQGRDESSAVR
ncbi:MAG: hypothetical protein IJI60_00185 [Bacilli bacterium]|nr:hypothetical protein [Bacilli bacterium]